MLLEQLQAAIPAGRMFLSGCAPHVPEEQLDAYLQQIVQDMSKLAGVDVQIHDASGVCEKFPYAFSVPEGTDVKAIKKVLYPPCPNKLNLHAGEDDPEFQAKIARRQAWLEKQRNEA